MTEVSRQTFAIEINDLGAGLIEQIVDYLITSRLPEVALLGELRPSEETKRIRGRLTKHLFEGLVIGDLASGSLVRCKYIRGAEYGDETCCLVGGHKVAVIKIEADKIYKKENMTELAVGEKVVARLANDILGVVWVVER